MEASCAVRKARCLWRSGSPCEGCHGCWSVAMLVAVACCDVRVSGVTCYVHLFVSEGLPTVARVGVMNQQRKAVLRRCSSVW